VLRAAIHDKDEALRVSEKTYGELRDEVMGLQTHSEGNPLVMFWPWRRGPWLMLTQCLRFRVGEAAACGPGDDHLVLDHFRGRGRADSVALGRYHLGV
jgi:hypothetical protein